MTEKIISPKGIKNQYRNRELSWLQFNARVLQEAEDESVPLIERLRFIGIFSNNLDEFFKVRYATLKRIDEAGKGGRSFLGGFSAKELMEEITNTVINQQKNSLRILKEINKQLEIENIFVIDETEVTPEQGEFISDYFIRNVSPAMVTIMIGELEKFPSLKDSAAYLAVKMVMSKDDDTFETKYNYALIEIPRSIDRFVVLPREGDKQFIIILDDLIRYCLHNFSIFLNMKVFRHI